MNTLLLIPPIAFVIVLIFMLFQLWGLSIFSRSLKETPGTGGRTKAYACGEDLKNHRVQPDYSQFFHFAFFFTIMHVVALIVATIPHESFVAIGLAVFYVLAAIVGLLILVRR